METINCNNVLLVRVPHTEEMDFRELRDYIVKSLEMGVLVLWDDTTCEVLKLPSLGAVEVITGEPPPTPPPEPEAEEPSEGAEKRAILQRLKDYRATNGLGSLEKVSAKTAHNKNQRISSNDLRSILADGIPMHIEEWRKIARALDKLEQEVSHAESHHGD